MDTGSLAVLLREGLPGCTVTVETDGYHYTVIAVGELFEGLRPVQRQQKVYAAIKHLIADGTVHAVNIKAMTPAENGQ
ncbi:MAG: BolA/IbaG family iron-sulfur metabolism protein [Gammaproteobacteria bacterium]|nr:MAG: BolA/IbaG family iron-sulfur metabolism protein [Gammaproteobacteria bacterium]